MEAAAQTPVVTEVPRQSFRSLAWRRFLRHRLALCGAVVVILIMLTAVFAPWLAPREPNRVDLMLAREVQEAVEAGKFNIWSVSTIAEGIELLTGVEAGSLNKHGNFPAKTVFGEAQKRLKNYFDKGQNLKNAAK